MTWGSRFKSCVWLDLKRSLRMVGLTAALVIPDSQVVCPLTWSWALDEDQELLPCRRHSSVILCIALLLWYLRREVRNSAASIFGYTYVWESISQISLKLKPRGSKLLSTSRNIAAYGKKERIFPPDGQMHGLWQHGCWCRKVRCATYFRDQMGLVPWFGVEIAAQQRWWTPHFRNSHSF